MLILNMGTEDGSTLENQTESLRGLFDKTVPGKRIKTFLEELGAYKPDESEEIPGLEISELPGSENPLRLRISPSQNIKQLKEGLVLVLNTPDYELVGPNEISIMTTLAKRIEEITGYKCVNAFQANEDPDAS